GELVGVLRKHPHGEFHAGKICVRELE
ncbi:MAG: hypothetical protein QOF25_5543, partial [Mycobacterium sp.]|nr:hypothetical protein [Mycobacterium sp.]